MFIIALVSATILPIAALAVNTPTVMLDKTEDLVVSIGAAIVVIGWVVAGILYLMSRGDPSKLGTAKSALVAAIIGTVLVIIAKLGYDAIQSLLNPIIGN